MKKKSLQNSKKLPEWLPVKTMAILTLLYESASWTFTKLWETNAIHSNKILGQCKRIFINGQNEVSLQKNWTSGYNET